MIHTHDVLDPQGRLYHAGIPCPEPKGEWQTWELSDPRPCTPDERSAILEFAPWMATKEWME